jgi:hypothetical protein
MKRHIFLLSAMFLSCAAPLTLHAADDMHEKARINQLWGALSRDQQDVAIAINRARSEVDNKISNFDCTLMTASFMDNPRENSFFRKHDPSMNDIFEGVRDVLWPAGFNHNLLDHIATYIDTLQDNVDAALTPFLDQYTALQKKVADITEEDTKPLRDQVEYYQNLVKPLFPQDIDAVKKVLFKDIVQGEMQEELRVLAEQRRIEEERRLEEIRLEEERKRLVYEAMVNDYVGDAEQHLAVWTQGLLEKLNVRGVRFGRIQPYANILEGMNADPESSMEVTDFFQRNKPQIGSLFNLLKRFHTNATRPVFSEKDIEEKVRTIENDNNYMPLSTLRHLQNWQREKHWKDYAPALLEGLTWLHTLDPDNGLPLLVLDQQNQCMSGLMGRTFYQLMQKLEGNIVALKENKIQLYEANA